MRMPRLFSRNVAGSKRARISASLAVAVATIVCSFASITTPKHTSALLVRFVAVSVLAMAFDSCTAPVSAGSTTKITNKLAPTDNRWF